MHILIVDDEKPARGELRFILQQLESTATYLEAANGAEALQLLAKEPVDVLFLDINMPGMSGLAVAAAIMDEPRTPPPLIVFATAYDAHALRAFELAAIDYIVKPFNEIRLAQTFKRLRPLLAQREQREEKQTALRTYLAQNLPASTFTRLWGQRPDATRVLVDYRDILCFEADGPSVYLHSTAGERLLTRYTLKELETRLPTDQFSRIHKAYIVNLNHVAELIPWFSGSYQIRLNTPTRTELPLSRQYAPQFKKQTGLI